jgi:predicted metal-binding membrane protein
MEASKTTSYNETGSNLLWVVGIQALLGVLIVGVQVVQHWHAWRLMLRMISLLVILMLVLVPSAEIIRRRQGKEVRFGMLAVNGYLLVWITAYLFGNSV